MLQILLKNKQYYLQHLYYPTSNCGSLLASCLLNFFHAHYRSACPRHRARGLVALRSDVMRDHRHEHCAAGKHGCVKPIHPLHPGQK